ncbi:MAG: flavodoxin-dependent (E)-4-hydroxy-3-methylbut-2-enyl-diphosphate synthase [bacterium]
MQPALAITRRQTRQIHLGSVEVGGSAPISVQTMTKTDTRNVNATVAQIREIEQAGCDIVRLAVVDEAAAQALASIKKEASIPLIADIHFNHKLALMALESGIDGLRLNPGNIGSLDRVREVVKAAADRKVPIRIGVNAGSLEKDLLEKYAGATAEALVESAMRHVHILEDAGHPWIKISVKASDVPRTLQAYRLLSRTTDHPLHLGVTEAGTLLNGTIRSSVAMGMLIAEGIGDTLRVSLTDSSIQEVRVGLELLRCFGLRPPGASVISCPTCGRIQIDVVSLAQRVERELDKYYRTNPTAPHPTVAVMGCLVNGPGEAREADIAIAGGHGKAALYVKGAFLATVQEDDILDRLIEQVKSWR